MYVFESKHQGERVFACRLTCVQCSGTTLGGRRCTKTSCIGTPFCWMHLLRERKLRIKESTIPGIGKGLFALDKRPAFANAILFRPKDTIITYDGESVTHDDLQRRYGDFTAPYAISEGRFAVDSACKRGAGSLANYSRTTNARLTFSRTTKTFKLIATKNIRNGAEIFCSYGRSYRHNDGLVHKTSQRARTFQV